MNVPSSGYPVHDTEYYRKKAEEEWEKTKQGYQQRQDKRQQGEAERMLDAMMGSADRGFQDGPIMSNIPGSSYKTRGGAPRYHEEIPMGGARGVWAIRNDEIAGPKSDPFQNMSPREWADSISRGIGRRFRGRR